MQQLTDISPDWNGSTSAEREALEEILRYEATPHAITLFAELQHNFGDYWYWFTLSTLWVSYTGWSDLNLWRKLFKANRLRRRTSLMKPSEIKALNALPDKLTAYRAHRPAESDWMSYTLDLETAFRFARERDVSEVVRYEIKKKDVLALFLRRGEHELLVLDPHKAKRKEVVPVE